MVLGWRLQSVAITAIGVDPQTFTELGGCAGTVLFRCCLIRCSLCTMASGYPVSVFVDPTTAGVGRQQDRVRLRRSRTGRSNACRSSRPICRQTAASSRRNKHGRDYPAPCGSKPRERGGSQPLAPGTRVDRHRLPFLHPQGRQGLQRPPGMGARCARAGAQQPRNRHLLSRAVT